MKMSDQTSVVEILFDKPSGKNISKTVSEVSSAGRHAIFKPRKASPDHSQEVYVLWADNLDEESTSKLRGRLSRGLRGGGSRLLMLAKESSSDTVAARIVGLGIQNTSRFYAFRVSPAESENLRNVIFRLIADLSLTTAPPRILDAKIERGSLVVVSTDFKRIELPFGGIPLFNGAPATVLKNFEIDEDGAFVYWPELDIHLGWEQFEALFDPKAALKARQKSFEFNRRFGKAIRSLRDKCGLKQTEIAGLSARQVLRIENGECRATSGSIEKLAKAHGLPPDDYLQRISSLLPKP